MFPCICQLNPMADEFFSIIILCKSWYIQAIHKKFLKNKKSTIKLVEIEYINMMNITKWATFFVVYLSCSTNENNIKPDERKERKGKRVKK